MTSCKHEDLEPMGEQKTDIGVNTYFRCKKCGEVIVITPERKAIGIKGRP